MNSLSIDLLKVLLAEMENIQKDHPKATVVYDIERRRIELTYPLPKDFGLNAFRCSEDSMNL